MKKMLKRILISKANKAVYGFIAGGVTSLVGIGIAPEASPIVVDWLSAAVVGAVVYFVPNLKGEQS